MTERGERSRCVPDTVEPPQTSARDILEEHPLDRLARAKRKHLIL